MNELWKNSNDTVIQGPVDYDSHHKHVTQPEVLQQ